MYRQDLLVEQMPNLISLRIQIRNWNQPWQPLQHRIQPQQHLQQLQIQQPQRQYRPLNLIQTLLINSYNNANHYYRRRSGMEQEKSGMEQEKPGMEKEKPGVGQEKSGMEKEKPGVGQEKSGMEQEKPRMEQEKPGVGK